MLVKNTIPQASSANRTGLFVDMTSVVGGTIYFKTSNAPVDLRLRIYGSPENIDANKVQIGEDIILNAAEVAKIIIPEFTPWIRVDIVNYVSGTVDWVKITGGSFVTSLFAALTVGNPAEIGRAHV